MLHPPALTATAAAVQSVGHTTQSEWLLVAVPLLVLALASGALVAFGDAGAARFPLSLPARASSSLRRLTGLPGWSAGGFALQAWAIVIAGLGFYWDVAWHIDLGRDNTLFTPAHVLILLGIGGIAAAGVLSIVLASVDRSPTAWSLGWLRIPRAAAALVVIGAGATAGFPLDDLWHANYGVDVTMWGPTHLLMIGGASLTPIAAWLLLAEAGANAGRPWVRKGLVPGAVVTVLIGLSAFQLEFDDGVPQWQALFQPLLIAIGATLPMVAARIVLGRGAAVRAAIGFLAVRGVVALIVGPGLGHVVPRLPLYLGIALCVEAGFYLAGRRSTMTAALAAGVLAGTLGVASEWAFSHLWGRMPWQPGMLPGVWVAVLGAVAAAVVGAALAGAVARRGRLVPAGALAVAGLVLVGVLLVPIPRHGADVSAVVRTTPVGPAVPSVDRFGLPSSLRPVSIDLEVTPAAAVRDADVFWVQSWQGGGKQAVNLVETSPGHWRTTTPIVTGGAWKTIVYLSKADVVAAIPVSMPADREYGQAPIALSPQRTERFAPASRLLMRESHGGAAWPALVAYSALLAVVVGWLLVLVGAAASIIREDGPPPPDRTARQPDATRRRRRLVSAGSAT
jgi:hypothetical protein